MPEKKRGIFDTISMACAIYVKNIGYIALLCLMAFAPVFIINMFIPEGYYAAVAQFQQLVIDYYAGAATTEQMLDFSRSGAFADVMSALMILILVELVFFPLATGGITYITRRHMRGKPVSFSGLMEATIAKMGKYILTTLLYAGMLLLMFSPLFLFAVYVASGFIFYQNVIASTGRWGPSSFMLSRSLVSGRRLRTFGKAALFIIVYYIAALLVDGLAAVVSVNILAAFLAYIVCKIILSLFTVCFALWFWNTADEKGLEITQEGLK